MDTEQPLQVHRCPKCRAQVTDRALPQCSTCGEPLPAEWLMTPLQTAKVKEIDAGARARFKTGMDDLEDIPTEMPPTANT